ncbi:hypothetical protein LCGC14_0576460 [marine sediment metagenome]|uniref:Uncharacterized protein n=1 Tax=marine sediment metagenome TaxID=412755 RepID=A0A0F9S170_9ZZZZ|nr:MAG: hypothetical protein Lokiarch_02060 [Candidatus Lokiarchaeum sp. GC14_75]HEC37738.1 hypothetical protein [bacterium]
MSSLKKGFHLKKFLDFDKNDKTFYVNYYLDEFKVVLKESLSKEDLFSCDSIIDRFDLEKYIYLTHFN